MADRPRATIPWLLVAASILLVAIVLYVLFGAYLPTQQRLAQIEAELREASAREAQLLARLEGDTRQRAALIAERDALATRVEALERELEAATRTRRR